MGGFSKWIGGGLGFVLGGPIGAVIGFAVGSLFGGSSVNYQTSRTSSRRETAEADFKMSLLVLIAVVMKADQKIMKAELEVAKRFLVQNFGEEGALEALQILKKMLDQQIDEVAVAGQINLYMNYSSKMQMIRLLFEIANADGELHEQEIRVIQRISTIFNISSVDFASLRAPFTKTVDREWAYKALEIEPNASNEDIKKAYRKMAMKFHPDKVHNLGEDMKKSATDKFRAINEAYEHIKKQRGFN